VTIIAGYPWYSDWGRDTFIAMHGLTLARGDFAAAGDPRAGVRESLRRAITAILDGNMTGARFGIRMLARTARHGAAFGAWRL